MIVITGATGNTGAPAADALLERGEKVRVIGRDAAKLERFASKGAEAFVGDVESEADMTRAFSGATAVYLMIPQALHLDDYPAYQERVSDASAVAVQKSGVRHAVVLSSIGAQHAAKVGVIVGLHNLEEKLNGVPGLNALYLRPAHFMENLVMGIEGIRMMNALPGAFPADAPLPMIATRDIGHYAAGRLAKRDFSGHSTQELLGPRDVTMRETASIVGHAIGKPNLAYAQLPFPVLASALSGMGLPGRSVELMVEMWQGFSEGLLAPQEKRSAANTTSTTLEQFAEEVFAPAFQRRAARA